MDVYTFIGRFLEEDTKKFSADEIKEELKEEQKNKEKPEVKTHIVNMFEGEIAGLLRILLLKNTRYDNITLYGSDGVGLTTSGMRSVELVFANRPADLNFGFLTDAILSGPQLYHNKYKNNVYEEHICPIFNS